MNINRPKIEKSLNDNWITIYPDKVEKLNDSYYDALELMDFDPKKAEKLFKKIIAIFGNGHLDAILHLGLLFHDTGKPIEGNALVIKAHKLAVESIPDNFVPGIDQLHWGHLENRPLLRTFHAYGLELMKEQNFEKAIKEFDFILKVNPNDNQGVRHLVIDCLFHLDRPADVLNFEILYPDEHSLEFLYGKFLALFLLDRKDEAKIQLKIARKKFPFVAEELTKTKHIFPADEFEKKFRTAGYGYPVGSRQEAFAYWSASQQFWNKAKNIYNFIEDNK